MFNSCYLISSLLWLVVVAVMDFKYRKFTNVVFLVGFFYLLISGFIYWEDNYFLHIFGGVVVFILSFPLWVLRGVGAGDVKCGLIVGFFWGATIDLVNVLLISLILTLCHAFIVMQIKSKNIYLSFFVEILGVKSNIIKNICNGNFGASVPLAGYMAVATVLWMLYKSPP